MEVIQLRNIIDILLVTILLFQVYKLLKNSGALPVFFGILAFLIAWFLVTYIFKLEMMRQIFSGVMSVGSLALIVIFQEEIREFFTTIGSRYNWDFFRRLANRRKSQTSEVERTVMPVVLACKNMSKTKTGALIIFSRRQDLQQYVKTGERIDSAVSTRLIENIFFKNTPLHDGALIITGSRLRAAACVLPVSRNMTIPQHLGLRHRAALGLTEKTDAIAVVVSEETGDISYAIGGHIVNGVKAEQIEQLLTAELSK